MNPLTNGAEPRLVAVRGPLKGSIYALPEGDYSVGRQSTCNLNLEDHAVSRKHCLFIRSDRQCTVKDLESRNGTFVNGTPVTEHQLEQGDEVRIGGSVFCFLVDRDHAAKPTSGDFKTRQLQVTDSIYLSSAGQSVLPPSARASARPTNSPQPPP